MELDGEAELQHGAAMADAAQALIRPRVGSNELGSGMACVLGKARKVEGGRGARKWQRDGGGRPAQLWRRRAAGLGLLVSVLRERGEREGKTVTALGEGIRTGTRSRGARFADVRRVATPTSMAGGELSKTGESQLTEIE